MPDRRYHIHLICAPDDQVAALDGLAIFMEKRAFLTRDLLQGDDEAANYSRRCIDRCDFLLLLVGDSYGHLVNTGVSQLHLSYIYANTKSKHMMIMMKLHNQPEKLPRQLRDFIATLEKEHSDSIYYYDDDVKMQEYIEPAYRKFLADHQLAKDKTLGWITPQKVKRSRRIIKKAELEISKQLLSETKNNVVKSKPAPEKNTELPANIVELETFFDEDVNTDFQIDFTTQAFQDGNLSEMEMEITLTWLQVLKALAKLPSPVRYSLFQRTVNDLVNNQALQLVQVKQPKVHAVSRTSVNSQDLEWIHKQLVEFGWLIKKSTPKTSRSALEMIELSPKGKQAVQDSKK